MTLVLLILFPLIGALVAGLGRGMSAQGAGRFALVWALGSLIAACALLGSRISWEPEWIAGSGMSLRFALDGLSGLFLVLTGLVTLIAIASSLLGETRGRAYYALILTLQAALFGVFTARHFIPWFLCWEMTLIPAWLLIRLWGGPKAPKAAMRFFLMTLGGSAFLLIGFLALQMAAGTMDFDELGKLAANGELAPRLGTAFAFAGLAGTAALTWVAVAVFLGLAVKIPVVPFHAWLPAAYAEAPTPVTMLLTGLLSKMGVYALLRIFLPVFPEVLPILAPMLAWLAVATILLGAIAALAQTDLKRMLAYSSVNHLGYCVLAMAAVAASTADRHALSAALSGTVLQAFNHGVIASALFFGIAILEGRSGGARGLRDFGGLRSQAPVFCGLFGIAVFASLGLPGLSGFIGEFLIFHSAFALIPAATSFAVLGLLLTAVFLLRMMRLVFWGPLPPALAKWPDLAPTERWILGGLAALIALYGVLPSIPLDFANPALIELLDLLRPLP